LGINAHGPEWDKLARFMHKFGKDRILAADHSSYDLRKSSCMTLASFYVYEQLAKATGNYDERAMKILRGIASDTAYPTLAYNGTLIGLDNMTCSGQTLTTTTNSTDGSLYNRCCYRDLMLKNKVPQEPYRKHVAMGHYGDDEKGSVSEKADAFNIISLKDYLGVFGVVITMPDKKSEFRKYMNDEEADFLKRTNRYDPVLGHYVACLAEDSIFKSLHCRMESKEAPEDIAAGNISTALDEWFFYGKDHFEMRREQMQKVADLSQIVVPKLADSYEDRVKAWFEKYYPGDGLDTTET